MADLVLFPHCDLHVALHGAPNLVVRVASRDLDSDSGNLKYNLTDVTAQCTFDLFAPYNPVGSRLAQFVTITPSSGVVTPIAVGINFFQVRSGNDYIIGRIQVHDTIQDWWFGNASITTAKDANFAHAQPSIYALFSDDPSKTDLVGDITGHGYVPLTSSDTAFFTVNVDGRLQGVQEGTGKTVSGTFLGKTNTLPVTIVDYAKPRKTLEYVQIPDVNHLDTMHNMLFIGEAFRDRQDDRDKFDKIVTQVVDEMLTKPRHAPYNLLQGSFNIWKAYEPSAQHCVTCGFRVNDIAAGPLSVGRPIPYSGPVSSNTNVYTPEQLVEIVGLPLRGESRSSTDLINLWNSQTLRRFDATTKGWVNNLDPTKVDDSLVSAWKGQTSVGILEARDTFFGLYLGGRPADRSSGRSSTVVPPPVNDNASDANLAPFISRIYEWFNMIATRTVTPDPRRHPPELQAGNQENLGNSILTYIGNLVSPFAPTPNVGPQWVPDGTGKTFKRSRGLVALITNDGLDGGTNFNALTVTANTLNQFTSLKFQYTGSGTQKVMQRLPPDSIAAEVDDIINTVAHEFGHSFHLDDEYEEFVGDQPNDGGDYDNRCVLSEVNLDANFAVDRNIDPSKVKWFELLRMDVSDALAQDSVEESGRLKLTIDPRFTGRWTEAKAQNKQANLRTIKIAANGRQLPLEFDTAFYLAGLDIEEVDEGAGIIYLGGGELPPSPFPVYPAGSLVFVPQRDSASNLVYVVEQKVLGALNSTHLPLNKDTDTTKINKDADDPVDIANFKPPCKSYKLVGIYEGAGRWTGMIYRPAGLCKMRNSGDGEFCHVCKYLIVNRVNPGNHVLMDKMYYPAAKKNG
jgi:hypothetical protein